MTLEDLLLRRLVFVVGKGGVGRTTVTLALGLEAARRGKRALLVEIEGAHGLEHALAAQRESGVGALERIDHLVVEGRRALEEYLSLIIPVRRLLRTIFSSNVYQYFVAAAPGLRELMTVGKIWYEAERAERERTEGRHGDGPPAPDVVIVDGPATGHSLQYLRMPKAAAEAFPVGLVHREAERVLALLRDRSATAVVIVSTAEEMPVNETAEIYAGLRDLDLPHSVLVVNQVRHAPLTSDEMEAVRRGLPGRSAAVESDFAAPGGAGGIAASTDEPPPIDPERLLLEVVARAEEECGWAAINRQNIERLARTVPLPTVLLPLLFSEEFGGEQVARLARVMAEQLDGSAPASGRAMRKPRATPPPSARRARSR